MQARILYVDASSKKIMLSLQPDLRDLSVRSLPTIGEVFEVGLLIHTLPTRLELHMMACGILTWLTPACLALHVSSQMATCLRLRVLVPVPVPSLAMLAWHMRCTAFYTPSLFVLH